MKFAAVALLALILGYLLGSRSQTEGEPPISGLSDELIFSLISIWRALAIFHHHFRDLGKEGHLV